MIQIDDAGSGSFIGGTCIGIYRPETNEYYYDIIPVELYNKDNFNQKHYLNAVVDIVSDGFSALEVKKNETIEICRGYMFDRLKEWLSNEGFFWYGTHITGHFQDLVEKNFELYTISLGLPESYIKYTHFPFHFHKLLKWVYADFDNRIGLCKVGWKSWANIENIRPEESFSVIDTAKFSCMYCGKRIRKGSRVRVLKFTTNREHTVYLHMKCNNKSSIPERAVSK